MQSKQFLHFCIVGLVNTAIDVSIFVVLIKAGLSLVTANILSTSVALTASFMLHHRYTFRAGTIPPHRVIRYAAITLWGLWVLHPLVLTAYSVVVSPLITPLITRIIPITEITATAVGGKALAIFVTIIWNYTLYRKFVFTKGRTNRTTFAS